MTNTLRIILRCRRKRVIYKITNSIWTPQTFVFGNILFCVGSLNGWNGCASLNKARGQGEPESFGWNWREFLIRDHLVTTGDRRYRLIESTRLWRRFERECFGVFRCNCFHKGWWMSRRLKQYSPQYNHTHIVIITHSRSRKYFSSTKKSIG